MLGLWAQVRVARAAVGRPWLVLAHVVGVDLVVNGTEHLAGLATSSTVHAAGAPRAVAPAEAGPGIALGQVELVVHAGIGLLADELDDQRL